MRDINELLLLKKRAENKFNQLRLETNRELIADYNKKVLRIQKIISILDDTIQYYDLISYVYGDDVKIEDMIG